MFSFILELLFETIFFYTGEIILFIITFGRKKPRWDYYAKERGFNFVVFSQLSEWIGIVFWIVVIGLIIRIVSK